MYVHLYREEKDNLIELNLNIYAKLSVINNVKCMPMSAINVKMTSFEWHLFISPI